MKIEVEIPQKYIQRIEETALKKLLERSLKNAGN